MTINIIIAGTGGQGVLTAASVVALSALQEGLTVTQSEVHGIAQRGGSVTAQLRIADTVIHCCQISRGTADIVIGMEVVEGLRYASWLKHGGNYIAAVDRKDHFPGYPAEEILQRELDRIPHRLLIEAEQIALQQGGTRLTANMVLMGAASVHLPSIGSGTFDKVITDLFDGKNRGMVENNLRAFAAGRALAGG